AGGCSRRRQPSRRGRRRTGSAAKRAARRGRSRSSCQGSRWSAPPAEAAAEVAVEAAVGAGARSAGQGRRVGAGAEVVIERGRRTVSLTAKVLLALLAGLGIGVAISVSGNASLLAIPGYVEPIGTIWVNALR